MGRASVSKGATSTDAQQPSAKSPRRRFDTHDSEKVRRILSQAAKTHAPEKHLGRFLRRSIVAPPDGGGLEMAQIKSLLRTKLSIKPEQVSDVDIESLVYTLDQEGTGKVKVQTLLDWADYGSDDEEGDGEPSSSGEEEKAPMKPTVPQLSISKAAGGPKAAGKASPKRKSVSKEEDDQEPALREPESYIDKLHLCHAQYRQKMQRARKEKEQDELKQLEIEQAKLCELTRKYEVNKLNGTEASRRLHQQAEERRKRVEERQEEFYVRERKYIQAEAREAMALSARGERKFEANDPTQAAKRLYLDARRRARDLESMQMRMEEAHARARSQSPGMSSARFEELYLEAEQRRERIVKMQKDIQKQDELPSKNRCVDMARIYELHNDHAARRRRMANLLADSQIKELTEDLELMTPSESHVIRREQMRSKSAGPPKIRPSVCDDLRSPRSIRSPRRRDLMKAEQDAITQKRAAEKESRRKEQKGSHVVDGFGKVRTWKPSTKVGHMVAAIADTLRMRCDFTCEGLNRGACAKRIAEPLYSVHVTYQNALKTCEASLGYSSLCSMPSLRLHNGRLMPDAELWARNLQAESVRQVEDDLDDLLVTAQLAQEQLKEMVAPGSRWDTGDVRPRPAGVHMALYAYDPGVKLGLAARAKAVVRYGATEGKKRARHLTDLSRLSLVFGGCDMLQAGLYHIMKHFEVVDVRNMFATPALLGMRWIEVLVIVLVEGAEKGQLIPHVCELRLEEIGFHKAAEQAHPYMRKLYRGIRDVYDKTVTELGSVMYLAHSVLTKPVPRHEVRIFRSRLANRYGSTVSAWRRFFGSCRLASWLKFRELCNHMDCGPQATEMWESLDCTRAGCISLFDFDPEALMVLVRFRDRVLAIVGASGGDEVDLSKLFARLTYHFSPQKPQQLTQQEFRLVTKPMGISADEANRLFSYLDMHGPSPAALSGSNTCAALDKLQACVSLTDIAWLLSLACFVDLDSAALTPADVNCEGDELRHTTWSKARTSKFSVWPDRRQDEVIDAEEEPEVGENDGELFDEAEFLDDIPDMDLREDVKGPGGELDLGTTASTGFGDGEDVETLDEDFSTLRRRNFSDTRSSGGLSPAAKAADWHAMKSPNGYFGGTQVA